MKSRSRRAFERRSAALRFVGKGLCVLCSVVVAASVARGQDVAVPRDQRAREIFQEGRLAAQAGDLRVAATRFERAFELSGRPILLLNIASAFETLGEAGPALAALQQYLLLTPGASGRVAIESRIRALGGTVPRRRITLDLAAGASHDEPTGAVEDDTGGAGTSAVIVPWIAAGMSAVALAAGGALFIDAAARYQSLSASCGSIGCPDDEVDGVGTRVTAAWALTGLAAAFAATAGVLFFVLDSGEDDDVSALSEGDARIGVGPTSVALYGRFP